MRHKKEQFARKNIVVHLPHPAAEHSVKLKEQDAMIFPWNRNQHRRKFICNKGKCLDSINGEPNATDVDLYFWGEWEQPSKVSMIGGCPKENAKRDQPTYMHQPIVGTLDDDCDDMFVKYVSADNPNNGYQNTDPYVYGECFYYSCCRQTGKMKQLQEGDIIIFYGGDEQNGKQVKIDTVFVVGGKRLEYGRDAKGIYVDDLAGNRYYNDDIKKNVAVSDTYLNGVLNAIWYGRGAKKNSYFHNVLYYGATQKNPVNGMFSYFICKTGEEGKKGFPRVSYQVSDGSESAFGFSYSIQKQKFVIKTEHMEQSILEFAKCESTYDYWFKLTNSILNHEEKYKLGIYTVEPR